MGCRMRSSTGHRVSGDDLIDREPEPASLGRLVREGNHVLLTRRRRIGKTSLLRELGHQLEDEGWIFLFSDVEGAVSREDVVADLTRAAHPIRPVARRMADAMGHLFDDRIDEIGAFEFRVKDPRGTRCGKLDASRRGSAAPLRGRAPAVASGPAAMTATGRHPIRKFNPGTFQSDREVVEQFVVRTRELDTVLGILRDNVGSPSCQHMVVVAPRGRGKTMLLARTAAELRTNGDFSGHLLPVRFMEESQEIFHLADFWLETLFHLAGECESRDPGLAGELRTRHAELSGRWREPALEGQARASVLDAADRLGRRLVLMVENLQALFRDVDEDFGWKLRSVLQTEPQIMLLGSATSRFPGLDDAEQRRIQVLSDHRPAAARHRGMPPPLGDGQRGRGERARDAAARDPHRREPPASRHRRRGRPSRVDAPPDGRAGRPDRRPHRVLPRASGRPAQDRAARVPLRARPLAALDARGDRGPRPDGPADCVDDARPAGQPRGGDGRRQWTEAAVRRRGAALQHLLQAAARTRRSRPGGEHDPLHGGVLRRSGTRGDVPRALSLGRQNRRPSGTDSTGRPPEFLRPAGCSEGCVVRAWRRHRPSGRRSLLGLPRM